MGINWIIGQGNFGVEMICPRRHIKSSQWQPVWNQPFPGPPYDYIPDYECVFPFPLPGDIAKREDCWPSIEQVKAEGTSISITNLVHVTKPHAALDIINDNGFKGYRKIIDKNVVIDKDVVIDEDVVARLSWWSAAFYENDVQSVREHLDNHVIYPFLGANDNPQQLRDQFATSKAFNIQALYGNIYFMYTIKELCWYYEAMIGMEDQPIHFKVLGTYLYKAEIMHAVLVCGNSAANGMFSEYPDVPDNIGNPVVSYDGEGNWVWKPQATATEIRRFERYWQPYPMYRRWDNVAFAFHLPSKNHILAVNDIKDHEFLNKHTYGFME